MEAMVKQGKCKAIGVCDFSIPDLEYLMSKATIVPAVNKFELTPYHNQLKLVEYCHSVGIAVIAYSPLKVYKKLNDKDLGKIADKYKKSLTQIMIRWALQHDTIVTLRSVDLKEMIDYTLVYDFEISESDMEQLDSQFDAHIKESYEEEFGQILFTIETKI